MYKYLALRVRAAGDPPTRNSYFVNIQTDGPVQTDLWQHRLYFEKEGEWEDIFVRGSVCLLSSVGPLILDKDPDFRLCLDEPRGFGAAPGQDDERKD